MASVKLQLMSTAQILEEIKSYPTPELESLEDSIRLERLRRTTRVIPEAERRLLRIINEPMPEGERHAVLLEKWQDEGLSEDERAEMLEIVMQREGSHVERVEAVMQLSELRGVPFAPLWKQLMGEAPDPIVPIN